jgi:acyl-CoA dehydrogenase
MQFELSAEQRLIVDNVRRFVYEELVPLEDEVEEAGRLDPAKARAIFEKSRALGFYAMNIPDEYGGGGLSAVDTMLVEEQFGHTKDILIRRAFGNVYESLLEGTPAQKERWLLPCVRGERTCSIAITEPSAGSDAAAIRTRAQKDSTATSISSATGCTPTSSSCPPSPIRPRARATCRCSSSTRTCPVWSSAATRR